MHVMMHVVVLSYHVIRHSPHVNMDMDNNKNSNIEHDVK